MTILGPSPAVGAQPPFIAVTRAPYRIQALVERFGRCLALWRRAADDREALARMSDRSLLDIGLRRVSGGHLACVWRRDPH